METRLHSRRRVTVPANRCQVCGGEGFCELTPLPNGKMACPSCRHLSQQWAEASDDRPKEER